MINCNIKEAMKNGATLTIYMNGQGVKRLKNGEVVQNTTQSIHHLSLDQIRGFLLTPSSQYRADSFKKLSETGKLLGHIEDFVNDVKLRVTVLNWKLD